MFSLKLKNMSKTKRKPLVPITEGFYFNPPPDHNFLLQFPHPPQKIIPIPILRKSLPSYHWIYVFLGHFGAIFFRNDMPYDGELCNRNTPPPPKKEKIHIPVVPSFSRIFQGLIFQGPVLCMLKKWFADYINKFRPEGMGNSNTGLFNTLFIKFQTMHISKITILWKIEMLAYIVYQLYLSFDLILIK